MALSVQEILDLDVPPPSWAWQASPAALIRSDMTFERPDNNSTGAGPDPTAREWDPKKQQWVAVGADNARTAYDPLTENYYGVLIEGSSRTNKIPESSQPYNWAGNFNTDQTVTSVLEGETAKELYQTSGQLPHNNAGQFASGLEVAYGLFQKGGNQPGLNVFNLTDGTKATVEYDWGTGGFGAGSIISQGSGAGVDIEETGATEFRGPNGVRMVKLWMRYNGVAGDNCRLYVNYNKDGTRCIPHYMNIEEGKGSSTPIVTASGSATTRGADNLLTKSSSVQDFWNENQGTVYFEVVALHNGAGGNVFNFNSTSTGVYVKSGTSNAPPWRPRFVLANTIITLPESMEKYERTKLAFSYRDNRLVVASNGTTDVVDNPNLYSNLTTTNKLVFNSGGESMAFPRASYRNVALNESELKTLTS